MNVQRWHPNSRSVQAGKTLEKLSATVLRFLDQDGADWSLGDDAAGCPAAGATRRRRAPTRASARAGLSPRGRPDLGGVGRARGCLSPASIRRRAPRRPALRPRPAGLGDGNVPAGLDRPGTGAYRRKWQKAVDIFALTHFADWRLVTAGGERPNLSMELDEAVAAQLPLIFDEIRRLGEQGRELAGTRRPRPGQ